MAPAVLYRVIYGTPKPETWEKERVTIQTAVLHGFHRRAVKFAEFPAIIANPSRTVRGAYIAGLTDRDIQRLDAYEGDMYQRRKVKVKLLRDVKLQDSIPDSKLASLEDAEVEAETYVWALDPKDLDKDEWDFENFRTTKLRAWIGDSSSSSSSDLDIPIDEGFADADRVGPAQTRRVSPSSSRSRSGQITEGRGTSQPGASNRGDSCQSTAGIRPADRATASPGRGSQGTGQRGDGGAIGVRGPDPLVASARGHSGQGPNHEVLGRTMRSTMREDLRAALAEMREPRRRVGGLKREQLS
jgi:Gamma-glutamyl cyclotransferase, AIG2-like